MDLSFLPDWPPVFPPAIAVAVLALLAAAFGEASARWLRLPRLLGYLAAGALFGAGGYVLQALNLEPLPGPTLQSSMTFAASIILFDLGQRVSFGWLRRNPALLGASAVESGLTFVAVFATMRVFDIAALPAALIATISMSTSPAVVLSVTREVRAQGQVTERVLLLTAMNSIYAVVLSTLLLAWARVDTRGLLDDYLLHPAYLIFGSLAIAALGARLFHLVAVFLHRDRAAELILMLAVVSIVFTASGALRLSPLLALLACGAFVRTFDRGRRLASSDLGLVSSLALVLFFALAAATVDIGVLMGAGTSALALALVRSVCKVVAAGALAPLTGIVWRKGVWTGLGLLPMSAIALMLTHEVTQLHPQLGAEAGAVVLANVIVFQVVGALTLLAALRASGEAKEER
ncbi:MAG TPA: cation:proton antiporter [Burkholderiaceae bacterium]|nr:cation:proton antiporter [Burkholderiaceae bacterium]HQR71175.1 cation:proton antiporter [Burkholderiaceae bacterium]